jgi:hypothetical protein
VGDGRAMIRRLIFSHVTILSLAFTFSLLVKRQTILQIVTVFKLHSVLKVMEGLIGQNYSPTKFGFCLGNVDFALVLLTLCV